MNEFAIIKSPLVTERSTLLREKHNQYVFKVDPDASKYQIKIAVKKIFNVDVKAVRTANYEGKLRRLSATKPQGRKVSWKKAYITLKSGQEIKIEEQVS